MHLRDGTIAEDSRLGCLAQFDARSRSFPVRDIFTADQTTPHTHHWSLASGTTVLNQGTDGSSVGFTVTNEMQSHPAPVRNLTGDFAQRAVYWGAQRIDGWPGGDYPGAQPWAAGTSILAAVRFITLLGFYRSYHWAFSEDDIARSVSYLGPVILGLPWYESMFHPAADGHLFVNGTVAGRHSVLVTAFNNRLSYYTVSNSFGVTWGRHGTARIYRGDMDRLLHEGGEACVITGRSVPFAP